MTGQKSMKYCPAQGAKHFIWCN